MVCLHIMFPISEIIKGLNSYFLSRDHSNVAFEWPYSLSPGTQYEMFTLLYICNGVRAGWVLFKFQAHAITPNTDCANRAKQHTERCEAEISD